MNRRVLWILLVASTLGCGVTKKDMEAQVAKYNQLLRIEELLDESAKYGGKGVFYNIEV